MNKSEREELARVARLRAKVARKAVEARQAELLADVEAQLSAKYKFDEKVWADITRQAQEAVREADERIAGICRDVGVPEKFRPELHLSWYERGESASKERRAELRKRAETRIEALAARAAAAIEAKEAEVLTRLIVGGLESEEAKAFLESIPTPTQLMPPVALGELEGPKALPRALGYEDEDEDEDESLVS
jgi:hypothetical protein